VDWSLVTDCHLEEHCNCEGHTCIIPQSIIGHVAVAATKRKYLGIALIIVVP